MTLAFRKVKKKVKDNQKEHLLLVGAGSTQMRPEQAELLLVEVLVKKSLIKIEDESLEVLKVLKLTGDASTRRYFRVYLAGGKTETFVVCLADPFEGIVEDHDFLSIQKLLKEKGIPVPNILDYELSKGYILQEDLGDKTLLLELSESKSEEAELEVYSLAIDHIISMHKIAPSDCGGHIFTRRSFDKEKFLFEFRFMQKHFLEMYLRQKLSNKDKKILEDGFNFIIKELLARPTVFTHRDYHSRNIMISDGKMTIIDFQDARLGPLVYDLVSLLEDSYYQVTRKNKNILLCKYSKEMALNWSEYQRTYDLMTVQRTLKAIGSFTYIYNHRKDDRYLKYVGFAFEKVRSTLVKFPELYEFKELIARIYYGS